MNVARYSQRRLIGTLFAVALSGCILNSIPTYAGDNNMTEQTKNMQPVCVGRFVMEIPVVARINGWDQNVNYTKIESIVPPSTNKRDFDSKIAQRVTQLKNSPHNTEGMLFKDQVHLTPDSDLLVYRENKRDHFLYQMDALFWRPAMEMKFQKKFATEDLAEGVDRITKLVKSFSPTLTINTTRLPAGLCIENGVMTGSTFRAEEVAVSGRIDQYPGLGFSFHTQTYGKPYDDPTMLERIGHSFNLGDLLGKEISASTKFLRKGKRSLNGQKGEEMVAVITINGETSFEANAEFYPVPNTLDKPMIEVSLADKTHDTNTHKPFNKNLTQEEFLALWDALLNSIKLRPGAI